jgi:3-ketosteroid 9alpha-monooxygenase subunit A
LPRVKVPFTWKPTGWFMIGWSAEIPPGTVKPLQYLGEHLVAYRTDAGKLHVLNAHCAHLGAHLGHNGKVNGECIECPYHGWGWGHDGINRYIPYEDRPNVSKTIKSWPVQEQHECIFIWHSPDNGPPRWDLPTVFEFLPELRAEPSECYRAFPELSIKYEREPVHPQITLENGPDSVHFKYVHKATVDPVLMEWGAGEQRFRTRSGWPVPGRGSTTDMALTITTVSFGVGGVMAAFDGSACYRLVFFTTPVNDECSDLFYSIWWPKGAGDSSDVISESDGERIRKEHLQTLWDDLEIWRYQIYVEKPALAQQDAKPYGALRKWARQFYELEPTA